MQIHMALRQRGWSCFGFLLYLFMAALCSRGPLYLCPVVSFYLLSSSSFFSSPNLSGHRLDVYHTSTHGVALVRINLECRSEMCCTQLTANTGRKKVAKKSPSGHHRTICRAISSQLRHVSTIGKNLLSSNISSTCPRNMVNFGPLAAQIVSLVWGTPANVNGFGVLAALLHGILVVGVSQTLRR